MTTPLRSSRQRHRRFVDDYKRGKLDDQADVKTATEQGSRAA